MDRSVVFLDLKGGCAPCDKPLMLRPILFCPVLTWVAQELTVCGAQRFFIVCDEAWQDEVREVMEGFDTRLFASAQEALADAEGEVIVVPGPVVPVYSPEDSRSVYAAECENTGFLCKVCYNRGSMQRGGGFPWIVVWYFWI